MNTKHCSVSARPLRQAGKRRRQAAAVILETKVWGSQFLNVAMHVHSTPSLQKVASCKPSQQKLSIWVVARPLIVPAADWLAYSALKLHLSWPKFIPVLRPEFTWLIHVVP